MTFNNQSFFSIALFRKLAEARPDCFSDLTSDVVRTFLEFMRKRSLPKDFLLYCQSIVLFQISNQFVTYINTFNYFEFLFHISWYLFTSDTFLCLVHQSLLRFGRGWYAFFYLIFCVFGQNGFTFLLYQYSVFLREKFILWPKEKENKSNRLNHK